MAEEQESHGIFDEGLVDETLLSEKLLDAFNIWPLVSELFAGLLANSSDPALKVAELLDRLSSAEMFVASIPGTATAMSEQEDQLAELNAMLKEKELCVQTFRTLLGEATNSS